MKLILAGVVSLFVGVVPPANGQTYFGPWTPLAVCQDNMIWANGSCIGGVDVGRHYAPTDDADLDRAVVICEAHEHLTGVTDGSWQERRIENAYQDDCRKVYAAWEKSDTARRLRDAKAKEAADREFLATYAKGLTQ